MCDRETADGRYDSMKEPRKQMDQDPGNSVAHGNEFAIGRSLTILLNLTQSQ